MPAKAPRPGDLESIETASRDELAALQLSRLQWSLAHAYENVPHYRTAFDRAGVHPRDLHRLDDLARFPFTVKNDLRDNYPFGMFAVPREQVVRVHASSGTTGKPTVVGYTRNDVETWATVMARSIRAPRRCRWASSAPSRGRRPCAPRSRSAWTSTPSTSTGCRR